MKRTLSPLHRTIVNILFLPASIAVAILLGLLIGFWIFSYDTPHEASFGDIGEGLLVVAICAAFACIAVIVWISFVLRSLRRHAHNKKFVVINISILVMPFLLLAGAFAVYRIRNAMDDAVVRRSNETAVINVPYTNKKLFDDGQQLLGYHLAGDTAYLVTGVVLYDGKTYSVTYDGKDWGGTAYIKYKNDRSTPSVHQNTAAAGSLRYYAYYNDSLYAGADKTTIVDSEYLMQKYHGEVLQRKDEKPRYIDYVDWAVQLKDKDYGCYDIATNYEERYPILYVADICANKPADGFPRLPGFGLPNLGPQSWRQFTASADGDLFCRASQQDSISIAHFTKTKARVYNLLCSDNLLTRTNNLQSINRNHWIGMFPLGDKFYIMGQQNLIYFKIPK